MNGLINKLKKRWGIDSTFQVLIILCTFALTGFSTLFVHRWIDRLLGIGKNDPFWIKAVVFVVIVLPVFNVLLLFWGTLTGQKKFFIKFIRLKLRIISGGKLFKRT